MRDQEKLPPHDGGIPRRQVLAGGAAVVSGLVTSAPVAVAGAVPSPAMKPSIYDILGVKRVINAAGTLTVLGGSLVPPEVVEAWADASRHFVDLVDLQNKVGARIAELVGVEAYLKLESMCRAAQLASRAIRLNKKQ